MTIDPALKERNPLITGQGAALLRRMLEHSHAPRWNYTVGDRITAQDLEAVRAFGERLKQPSAPDPSSPPQDILEWVERMRERVLLFQERILPGTDLARDWEHIPTSGREDLALHPYKFVPLSTDLDRLIVYDTSGTTGHSVVTPWSPAASSMRVPLVEQALAKHGVTLEHGPDRVIAVNVNVQAQTVVFATVLSVCGQAGFAKVNLHPAHWRAKQDAAKFLEDLAPQLITGDPVSLAEMAAWGVGVRPRALLSTAVAMQPGLARDLAARFGCPVLDLYSLTETGPLACTCPQGQMHLLPPDVYVEIVDEEGFALPDGQVGEITVTGGRNPYLPLLRYRTGDFGSLTRQPCACGSARAGITKFQGRGLVLFRGEGDAAVNPVDISRVLRPHILVQHRLVQRQDLSCELRVRPGPAGLDTHAIKRDLAELFGQSVSLEVILDPDLGKNSPSGKVIPFVSELEPGSLP